MQLVCFFVPYAAFCFNGSANLHGKDLSLSELGTAIALCAIIASNSKLSRMSDSVMLLILLALPRLHRTIDQALDLDCASYHRLVICFCHLVDYHRVLSAIPTIRRFLPTLQQPNFLGSLHSHRDPLPGTTTGHYFHSSKVRRGHR